MSTKKSRITDPIGDPGHMSLEEFRKNGYAAIDWLCDYFERIESYPVLSKVKPGQIKSSLPSLPPKNAEPFSRIMEDLDEVILPGITHWQAPGFFGYFPANASPPSILAEIFSAGLGVQGMLWLTSPSCTELEILVLDWIVEMMALPEMFKSSGLGGGVIQDSASSAVLCAVIAARELTKTRAATEGVQSRLIGYCSEEAHSSVEKAFAIAGLGRENLHKIPSDSDGALVDSNLEEQIALDLSEGLRPFFICGTVGSTSTLSCDPIKKLGQLADLNDCWLHVDSAMAGTAAVCPEFRYLNDGIELADSYCFNPHKWMLTNFDCNCFYVKDKKTLISALSILPEYLRNPRVLDRPVVDFRDWQIPLGRRFRALKLWFVIRSYGVDGIREYLRGHVKIASKFASWVEAEKDFEVTSYTGLNLVCFRVKGNDSINEKLLNKINETGSIFLSHTVINGRFSLRLCVGQVRVSEQTVSQAWEVIKICASGIET